MKVRQSRGSARGAAVVGLALAALGFLVLPTPASAANGIKAAYVESVIPSRTFFGTLSVLNAPRAAGPGSGAGVLGISSLTITNFDSAAQQVFIFVPLFADGATGCGGSIIGGAGQSMTVYVAPQSTLHLSYPTPFVVNPVSGLTCVGAQVTTVLHGGSVQINVNGVLN